MRLRLWQKLAIFGGVIVLILVLIPLLTYAYFARDIADQDRLMNRKNTGVVLADRNGEEFHRAYGANSSNGEEVPIDQMPDHVKQALITTEDEEFYEHGGYSIESMLAALYSNILRGDLKHYGGSTITQQLAKNALLSNEKTYLRKYQELSLAIAIERYYTKDQILEMYLNSVYFGEGAFGIADAAETYFDKPVQELTVPEASMLIGILPGPSGMSPISGDKEAAQERQELVLTNLQEAGHITAEQKETYTTRELQFQQSPQQRDGFAMHYAQMVLSELEERYGEEEIARSGFRVTTTLDISWQEQAKNAVQEQISRLQGTNATNGALVAIDPSNGTVRALVGSVDWGNEQFGKVNMATTPRQPGSSFKPIYYAEALRQQEITPATIIRDEPTTFGGEYQPENFDFAYRGDITVRSALAQSLNIPSVKVMERLGVNEAVDAAQNMGFAEVSDENSYGLSLALGTAEVQLLNLTNAYAAFANRGTQFEPSIISTIQDKYEETIHTHEPDGENVMSEGAAYLTSSILSDEEARAPTFGSSLNIDRTAAVKTGTTEDSRDALTVGYTPQLTVGVWVGNNSNESMNGIGGSTGAGPIWQETMQGFLSDQQSRDFQKPASVETVTICRSNGLPAESAFPGTYTEYFLNGSVPSGTCNAPEQDDQDQEQNDDQDNGDNEDDTGESDQQDDEDPQNPEEDTEDPSAPTEFSASSSGSDEVTLSWSASTDNTGVAEYEIYREGSPIDTVGGGTTSYTDSGLDSGTTYSYYVRAYDEAGNTSDPSDSDSATTDQGTNDSNG